MGFEGRRIICWSLQVLTAVLHFGNIRCFRRSSSIPPLSLALCHDPPIFRLHLSSRPSSTKSEPLGSYVRIRVMFSTWDLHVFTLTRTLSSHVIPVNQKVCNVYNIHQTCDGTACSCIWRASELNVETLERVWCETEREVRTGLVSCSVWVSEKGVRR